MRRSDSASTPPVAPVLNQSPIEDCGFNAIEPAARTPNMVSEELVPLKLAAVFQPPAKGPATPSVTLLYVAWASEPIWAPLFSGYVPAREWLDEMRPDLFLVVYNDHVNQFFFDAYPTFALGVGATHGQADEGWGKRNLPDLPGDPDFAWHLARSLAADEFDPTICQEMKLDHGVLSFLPLLTDTEWKVPVVPLALQNLWGSFFSRAGGRAMSKPFRRGVFSRVDLLGGEPVPASAATPAGLRERVGRLLAS